MRGKPMIGIVSSACRRNPGGACRLGRRAAGARLDAGAISQAGGEIAVISQSATTRFLESFGNVFFSLLFGAIAMGFFWYYLPDEFVQLQRMAAAFREWIASRGWTTRTETIIRFLLEDRQLLLMSFVLVMRFVLGLLALAIKAMFGRRARHDQHPEYTHN
jgi:hypothetical protein